VPEGNDTSVYPAKMLETPQKNNQDDPLFKQKLAYIKWLFDPYGNVIQIIIHMFITFSGNSL